MYVHILYCRMHNIVGFTVNNKSNSNINSCFSIRRYFIKIIMNQGLGWIRKTAPKRKIIFAIREFKYELTKCAQNTIYYITYKPEIFLRKFIRN